MNISDSAIVLATLFSPLIAVQVQKFIEKITERRTAQKRIFYVLMGTRATRVAPDHVQALNMIDLEFSGAGWRGQSAKEREVINRWRDYPDHLNAPGADDQNEARAEAWIARSDELFTDLLEALSGCLGYSFNRVELRRGIYRPRAHGIADTRQEVIQRALADVLTGQTPLAMRVTDFPVSQEAMELQQRVQQGLLDVVEGGSVKVKSVE